MKSAHDSDDDDVCCMVFMNESNERGDEEA